MRTQRSTAKIDSEYEMEADCESIRRIENGLRMMRCVVGMAQMQPSANAMPVVVWVGTAKEGAYERTEYLSSFAELPLALHCSDLARVKDNSKRDTTLAAPQRGCRGGTSQKPASAENRKALDGHDAERYAPAPLKTLPTRSRETTSGVKAR
ncbi:hypothetical protein R3P38DRAFT_2780877 [Favolaschia claudopus]|uniref:Uncharacterized protein n=1 Tax=Favolaschia claudopus TaxID=2862362 RepID=A0AAW0B7R5_9AGAR